MAYQFKLQSDKTILIILLAGLAVRFFLFAHFFKEPGFFYDDDSSGYIQIAENVRLGNGFSWYNASPFKPDGFRTPLYPLFLLSHRVIFGSYIPTLATQILLAAAIAYLTYVISRDFMNRPGIGLVAASIFLFTPFSVMVSINFLTQTLFTFVLTSAILMWLKFLKKSDNKYFIYAAILFPLSALIRPIAFLILVPLFLSLFAYVYLSRDERFSLRRILTLITIAIIIFIGTLSPWLIRNYRVFNTFSLSTIKYYQLYFYDLEYIYSRNKEIPIQSASQILETDINRISGQTNNHEYARDFTYSKLLKQRFIYYISEMPYTAIITRIELMFKFFIRDGIRYWIHYYGKSTQGLWLIPVITERIILFGIFMGMILSFIHGVISHNKYMPIFLNVAFFVLIYFAALTGVMASAGLRFPIEPLFLLLGTNGIYLLWGIYKNFIYDYQK